MTDAPPAPPTTPDRAPNVARGVGVIAHYLQHLPERPGVYRMIGADQSVLYVGKAKNLKKRVTNYTQPERNGLRIQRMIALTHSMEFVETHTEAEALLLEANLIKSLDPTYNVLLKDDKMHPYIMIPKDHDFPSIVKYRGSRTKNADYYGPFLSSSAVNDTIEALHKAFLIRNCRDSDFARRTRPCLQYHIKRCTAPCVGKVDTATYGAQIQAARDFLAGKSDVVHRDFVARMQAASEAHDFETAALWRDRIRALTALQTTQDINFADLMDADVIAIIADQGSVAVQIFFIRAGHNYGNVCYFPTHTEDQEIPAILSTLMAQFYTDKTPPRAVLVSTLPDDIQVMTDMLATRAGRKVNVSVPPRGARARAMDFAIKNAREALERHRAGRASAAQLQRGVQDLFTLPRLPERIEIYDNSHLGGTGQIGAMVVAGPDGFLKKAYRKFNIAQAGASDDYAMMREVMSRRFGRALSDPDLGPGTAHWPDLLLIDGGPGQLSAVTETLRDLGCLDQLAVVAISKGPDRNAGPEWLHQGDRAPFQLPITDPILHYLQRLRDEAHRFAIGTQRAKRQKGITKSILDQIPGIGAKRKKALLLHFGSARDVAAAGLADLQKVPGISTAFATKLYSYFHPDAPV